MPPSGEQAPPVANSSLEAKDAALLADLELGLPLMNQQVANSVISARNSPPSPPDPDAKRFWRVRVDWSVDTDGDGSPDWAEFEIAARGTGSLVAGVSGDAFNGDTNGDGIQDGAQLDADLDGVPDSGDPDAADNTATVPLGPLPRYAMFPITSAQPAPGNESPIQISDKGTVLYSNGTWSGGEWTSLSLPDQNYARAINDQDMILGVGTKMVREDPEAFAPVVCYWPAPDAEPAFISKTSGSSTIYPVGSYDFVTNQLRPGPVLSNDGYFSMPTFGWEEDEFKKLHTGFWRIPFDGQPAAEEDGDPRIHWNQGRNLRWGYESPDPNQPVGVVMGPEEWPELPFVAKNVVAVGENIHIAMGFQEPPSAARAYVNGGWKPTSAFSSAIDISSNGIAIAKSNQAMVAPIYLNGKWTGIDRAAPEVSADWRKEGVSLLDTTSGGWILAKREVTLETSEYAVMLPISIDGVDTTVTPSNNEDLTGGVDRISMAATGGTGRVPEIWIMAPQGGANTVRFRSPLNANCTLDIGGDSSFEVAPETLSDKDVNIEVKGLAAQTMEVYPSLRLGGILTSLSKPLGIKVMKKRIVKVALHKVLGLGATSAQTSPIYMPSADQLEEYLDKIYGRQVNVNFQVYEYTETGPNRPHPEEEGIDFDLNNDGKLWVPDSYPELDAATPNAKRGLLPAQVNIDVWVVGGVRMLYREGLSERRALGVQYGDAKIIADGDMSNVTGLSNEKKAEKIMHTIAHEIGHVFAGGTHADEANSPSKLAWSSSSSLANDRRRLMCSGPQQDATNPGKQLIKKEWGLIEAWLSYEEENGRL